MLSFCLFVRYVSDLGYAYNYVFAHDVYYEKPIYCDCPVFHTTHPKHNTYHKSLKACAKELSNSNTSQPQLHHAFFGLSRRESPRLNPFTPILRLRERRLPVCAGHPVLPWFFYRNGYI